MFMATYPDAYTSATTLYLGALATPAGASNSQLTSIRSPPWMPPAGSAPMIGSTVCQ